MDKTYKLGLRFQCSLYFFLVKVVFSTYDLLLICFTVNFHIMWNMDPSSFIVYRKLYILNAVFPFSKVFLSFLGHFIRAFKLKKLFVKNLMELHIYIILLYNAIYYMDHGVEDFTADRI